MDEPDYKPKKVTRKHFNQRELKVISLLAQGRTNADIVKTMQADGIKCSAMYVSKKAKDSRISSEVIALQRETLVRYTGKKIRAAPLAQDKLMQLMMHAVDERVQLGAAKQLQDTVEHMLDTNPEFGGSKAAHTPLFSLPPGSRVAIAVPGVHELKSTDTGKVINVGPIGLPAMPLGTKAPAIEDAAFED
jgi:hypothetical protein